MTTPKRNEAVAPVAWEVLGPETGEGTRAVTYVRDSNALRMFSGVWTPEPLYSQQTIDALQGEVSRLRELLDAVEVQAEENFKKWERAETKLAAHREAEKLCCKAFDALFEHSLSNGTYNYWGEALDCTPINDARRALTNLEPTNGR